MALQVRLDMDLLNEVYMDSQVMEVQLCILLKLQY